MYSTSAVAASSGDAYTRAIAGVYTSGRVIAHDGRPTEPEQTRFRDIDPLLSKVEAAMDGVRRTTLPPLNTLLASRGLATIGR